MAEKKIEENPAMEDQQHPGTLDNVKETPKPIDKAPAPLPVPVTFPSPRITVLGFTKSTPTDLYRRLLPAVLFVLTFVTVMSMLLIYMDNVAMGAQQFRLNMTRDYELARIGQGSAALVAYVRQLHLAPRAPPHHPPPTQPTRTVQVLDRLYGEIYNGTFLEFLPRGARDQSTLYLESRRGWDGAVVRAAPRDFLALRGAARALHACLSPTDHPREVTYQEDERPGSGGAGVSGGSGGSGESVFRSRVLCLPLYTVLLAADAARAQYVLLGGANALSALNHLPFGDPALHLQVIEVRSTDAGARNKTTQFLESRNYSVAAAFDDGVLYALKDEHQTRSPISQM